MNFSGNQVRANLVRCNRFLLFPAVSLICFFSFFFATPVVSWASEAEPQQEDREESESDERSAVDPSIVITEIHYNPPIKTDAAEFIELFNTSAQVVDLSGWALDNAIDYTFPAGTLLAPSAYLVVAQNPESVQRFWGRPALGPYSGKLSSQGEEITLRDQNAAVVDRVDYQLGFPWPTVGDRPGFSIGLMHPRLDNRLGAAWRSALPTPTLPNTTLVENPPPLISDVTHLPQQPTAQQAVQISAHIADADGVSAVNLHYQIVEPGNYIALDEPAYAANWVELPMTQMGTGDDQDLYRAEIPAAIQQHRRLIRYRIHAVDGQGASVTVPYVDDPQPNFAYFVYNGVPAWQGAIRPLSGNPVKANIVSYDFNTMQPMATYHLLSQHDDVRSGLFTSGYKENEYLWQGALVYDGVVYDHIRYRARGGKWRYSIGKNMIKFDFNRGHWFQAYDDYGQPYSVKWDKLNLSAVIQQGERKHRGEQGLFESVGYRLFNLAGVPSPKTHFIHFRIIDAAEETPEDQYEGDFFGLYLAVEQMDGQFIKEHGLPDGNLYKMEEGTGQYKNQGANSVSDRSDLDTFIAGYESGDVDGDWWRANLDLESYYNFRSILEAIHHYDIGNRKNYFYYRHPETGLWSILPWDIDQTWADNMIGDGNDPFNKYDALRQSGARKEYRNRLRELRDLLFNIDQVTQLLAEYSVMIDTPADGPSMVDADRARWDYSSDMESEITDPRKAGQGRFYKISPTDDFAGMATVMQEWVVKRSAWIDRTLLGFADNEKLPGTSAVLYQGPSGYPADLLHFKTTPFVDPQGSHTFAAMEWRIAELNYPALPTFRADEPRRYEIGATWQSAELTEFTEQIHFPAGSCRVGRTCRVRVRMADNSDRWGHWSPPLEFVAGPPAQRATSSLRITELMYNPLNAGSRRGGDFEFVELQNVGGQPVDLSNMRFGDGIDYRFPIGASLPAGEYLTLASNAEAFGQRYGFAPFGDYAGRLNNGGERLLLEDAFSRPLIEIDYDDDAPWPSAVDGDGPSLVLRQSNLISAPDDAAIWRESTALFGSPGAVDPLPVVINEVLANPREGQVAGIELYNPTAEGAPVGHWYLSNNPGQPRQYRLPANAIVPPDGYHFIPQDTLQKKVDGSAPLRLDAAGNRLLLSAATATGRLIGYRHQVSFAGSAAGVSLGRMVDSVGREHFVAQSAPTLGSQNAPLAVGPVVISTIMYHPSDGAAGSTTGGDEFIELTNISTNTVALYDLAQPELTWRMLGIDYQLPTGLTLAPNGHLLITLAPAADACLSATYRNLLGEAGSFENNLQVVGPYPQALPDVGASLALQRPMQVGDKTAYVTVDAIDFSNRSPWPNDLNGTDGALTRLVLNRFGNDPANWVSSQPLSAAAVLPSGPQVNLCSFSAIRSGTDSSGTEPDVQIRWTTHAEQDVLGYYVLRNSVPDRAGAVRNSGGLITAASSDTNTSDTDSGLDRFAYLYADETILQEPEQRAYYWLQAVGIDGTLVDVSSTELPPVRRKLYLPEVRGK